MAHFDLARVGDEGFLPQIGTLSGNPVAAVAGLATLGILRRPGAYQRLFATGSELMTDLSERMKRAGLPAQVVGAPPLFEVVFAKGEIRNYRDVQRADAWLAKRFNTLLRQRGIFKSDSKYYVSLAHTAQDVQYTCEAWESAIDELVHDNRTRP
jgi:glutamate-1-semialdehyde 2,1-aminomutase